MPINVALRAPGQTLNRMIEANGALLVVNNTVVRGNGNLIYGDGNTVLGNGNIVCGNNNTGHGTGVLMRGSGNRGTGDVQFIVERTDTATALTTLQLADPLALARTRKSRVRIAIPVNRLPARV